jgi:8-oxo-dGTP pyrophosphatase MutT (NUDIX family)
VTVSRRARVVIVDDGRVALIKRVRAGRTYYLFPGGGVEPGETPEQAAIREAHEELGVDVDLGTPRYEEDFDRSRFVYFDARIVGGEFGTGLWPDHADRDDEARARSGTHEPVWIPLAELDGLDVRPGALVELLTP